MCEKCINAHEEHFSRFFFSLSFGFDGPMLQCSRWINARNFNKAKKKKKKMSIWALAKQLCRFNHHLTKQHTDQLYHLHIEPIKRSSIPICYNENRRLSAKSEKERKKENKNKKTTNIVHDYREFTCQLKNNAKMVKKNQMLNRHEHKTRSKMASKHRYGS